MTDGNVQDRKIAVPDESSEVLVHVFGRTDVGMVREHNEDNFLIADLSLHHRSIQPEVQQHRIGPHGTVFAVCDGMGGAAAGEVASKIAVDTIYEMMQAAPVPDSDLDLAKQVDAAICEAGQRIHAAARMNSSQRGMGTTATVAALIGPRLVLGQVGDSRAHIVRNGVLVQTTKDQSLVQQLIDANQLTVEEARNFDRSNIILQALGTSDEVNVDITSVLLRRGDVLIMCSDGLAGLVEQDAIRDVIVSMESPMQACQRLTQMACDNGGDDNITVIVARFDGSALADAASGDVVRYEKYYDPQQEKVRTDTPTIMGGPALIDPARRPAIKGPSAAAASKTDSAPGKSRKMIVVAVVVVLLAAGVIAAVVVGSGSEKAAPTRVNIIRDQSADRAPSAVQDEAATAGQAPVAQDEAVARDGGTAEEEAGAASAPPDAGAADEDAPDDGADDEESKWPSQQSKRKIVSGSESRDSGTAPAKKPADGPAVRKVEENPY